MSALEKPSREIYSLDIMKNQFVEFIKSLLIFSFFFFSGDIFVPLPLFLGASLLSLVEVVYFVVAAVANKVSRPRSEK